MKSSNNKTLKYIALGIGLLASVFVLSMIVRAAFGFIGAVGLLNGKTTALFENQKYEKDFSQEFKDVSKLSLYFSMGTFEILEGDVLKIEGHRLPDSFNATQNGHSLKIEDHVNDPAKVLNAFSKDAVPHLTLTIPKNMVFKKVELEFGASTSKINGLNTDTLELDLGAGQIELNHITADEAQIKNGAGEVLLSDMHLNDLEMDCGVGNISYDGTLTGKSSIDGGVGNVSLNIKGDVSDYSIKGETGLGELTIDDRSYDAKSYINNNAKNQLKIDGGIGSFRVKFIP